MVTTSRVSALAVLLGLVLVVWSVGFLRLPINYEFHVDRETANVSATYAYENLSAKGQRAFRKAKQAEHGTAVIHGKVNAPDRFYYIGDYQPDNRGEYYIRYQGERYHLTTYSGGGLPIFFVFDRALLALFGISMVFWGVLSATTDWLGEPWVPMGWVVVLMALGVLAPWTYNHLEGLLLAGPGTLFVTGVAGLYGVS
ncbi:MAG: hypothetical protein ABEI77_08685 [Halorientalis sp.]